ncbi:MAG: glycerol-3-phosphate 1-O-acyltransferase PlsY [Pseudomonadota bacterium]
MMATAFIVAAYLIGSISFAVVISKLARLPDPHTYGSGNPGATNVLRSGNKLAALFTLLGDAVKGTFAVLLAGKFAPQYGIGTEVIPAVAVAVFLGHLYPVFHRFRGGKGVATALGVLLALYVPLGLCVLFIWGAVFYFSRISSLAAITAAAASPLLAIYFFGYGAMAGAVLAMALLLIWRHKANIRKLREGSEARVGRRNA